MNSSTISIQNACQNNLQGISLELPLNRMIVVSGVSGSGKSSLVFDTVYAEGQRRYVETFSAYSRQFLERLERPDVERVTGIPPAIAVSQTNPVRTSRSTVGTMTELNDYLKLLFSRCAQLYCERCGTRVSRDTPESVYRKIGSYIRKHPENKTIILAFEVTVPDNFSREEITQVLQKKGYRRLEHTREKTITVLQDRLTFTSKKKSRIIESAEACMRMGDGEVIARFSGTENRDDIELKFSSDLHCADCDIHYDDPTANMFSFNSPVGACQTCRGFGRIIGLNPDLIIPDHRLTLAQGAIKPFESPSFRECREDLIRFAEDRGVDTDTPWMEMDPAQRQWVFEGEDGRYPHVWYGVRGFFRWLEKKSYRMHIRVLLSKYRSYDLCPDCRGGRLKPKAMLWKINEQNIHEIMKLPLDQCLDFFTTTPVSDSNTSQAADIVLGEIRKRLGYLVEVGLGYLTLERQSRTLSGGEVQRINLTTALGTSLTGVLFILDEPSIGLHHRDIKRLIRILKKLRDAGNTLLIVEHDMDVIQSADLVLELGPGPGENGGRIVFQGSAQSLVQSTESITAEFITHKRGLETDPSAPLSGECIAIREARENNLKNLNVTLPCDRLICVTGVSGSGKTTLIRDVLYYGLKRKMGSTVETPGACREISGWKGFDDVMLVDQSAIGKTTRSNPASYTGVMDPVRKLFAKEPLAVQRRYTAGHFSFNSKKGACAHCGGNGFERVEMQFLSDVYLTCPECDGKRYRRAVLEVYLFGKKNIAEILDLTVDDAMDFFAEHPAVQRTLIPLKEAGLGYVRLGQPVPTLSGGESQRLKLAGYLADAMGKKGKGKRYLLLFDEPTTGLHPKDIQGLMKSFYTLKDAGHSVMIIEHNLDVIRRAQWILDLGPEGGENGGKQIYNGPLEGILKCTKSHTGRALKEMTASKGRPGRKKQDRPAEKPGQIRIVNAHEHNLKNIDLEIPSDTFTVLTGISGSGKSTVAFDILFAEGQRRYLESLNAYARQFIKPVSRPGIDAIYNIPPTVAIEQRTSRGGHKSTVATVTEIYHFIRLLFVKLGIQHCPSCRIPIQAQSRDQIVETITHRYENTRVGIFIPLVSGKKGFHKDIADYARKNRIEKLLIDHELVDVNEFPRLDRYKEHDIDGLIRVITPDENTLGHTRQTVLEALNMGKGFITVRKAPFRKNSVSRDFSAQRACPSCGRSFKPPDPRMFSFNSRHGWCPQCHGSGAVEHEGAGSATCPVCSGKRLKDESLSMRFKKRTISEYTALSAINARTAFGKIRLNKREEPVARNVLQEIDARLNFLLEVGLGYLTLDRAVPTLSTGESQRIRLASQLGSNLRNVCYILDEPTIGLHARDNRMLLDSLKKLRNKGNTVVVVEHDEETIRNGEHIIDLGPGGGENGGAVLAQGPLKTITDCPESVTGQFLNKPITHPLSGRRRKTSIRSKKQGRVRIRQAHLHNLKKLNVSIPLHRLVCVTGVSGSGKSTLVRDILYTGLKNVDRIEPGLAVKADGAREIRVSEPIDRILEVDQTPIGRTPRSCPATYVNIMNDIRILFSRTPEAVLRGYGPGRFSFNVHGGRCEECTGQGLKKIEMNFLPDVTVECDTCSGTRFNQETLAITYRQKNISDILDMSVSEAAQFFKDHPAVSRPLNLMKEVGIGYLKLGQQSPTLSGGEAQRLKLVSELSRADTMKKNEQTLYLLDEPTIGLHMADVALLIRVLHRLIDAGNSVIIIEHNLDIIAEADWIVDLGPEGGDRGGTVVAAGTPEELARNSTGSHTGAFLKEFLS